MGWRIKRRGFRIHLLAGEGAANEHGFFVLGRRVRGFAVEKFKMEFADLNDVAVFERVFCDGRTVDQSTVSAAAVF